MQKIVLYTRSGCHLCELAAETLLRHGLTFETRDIDTDIELRARYDQCVPVVTIDDQERFRGRIDELLFAGCSFEVRTTGRLHANKSPTSASCGRLPARRPGSGAIQFGRLNSDGVDS